MKYDFIALALNRITITISTKSGYITLVGMNCKWY